MSRVTLLILLLASPGYAAPDKVLYELQERCGKTAAQLFKHDWKVDPGTPMRFPGASESTIPNYRNHYNALLNKCFYLVTSVSWDAKNKESSTSEDLSDANENKGYGSFFGARERVVLCQVLSRYCKSKEEWDSLIRPYMED